MVRSAPFVPPMHKLPTKNDRGWLQFGESLAVTRGEMPWHVYVDRAFSMPAPAREVRRAGPRA